MLKQRKQDNNKLTIGRNAQIVLGVLIVVIGVFSLSYNYFLEKRTRVFDLMNIAMLDSEIPEDLTEVVEGDITNDVIETTTDNKQNSSNNNKKSTTTSNNTSSKTSNNTSASTSTSSKYKYIGYLEVPKVNLKKGFLDINSKYNTIDYNVTVVRTSVFPNVKNGNFILSAHSGNAAISYFRNLYKLGKNDVANVYYKRKKYSYKLVKRYDVAKNGKLSIYRNYNKTTLTLITCTKDNKKSQTIYIFELYKTENY